MSPANASLDPDLYCLHGRKSNVCKELSTGTGSEVERGTILVGILLQRERGVMSGGGKWVTSTHLSKYVSIEYLEDFVETKLEETLHRIAEKSGCPPSGQGPHSLLSSSQL